MQRRAVVRGSAHVAAYALVMFAAAWLTVLWLQPGAPHPTAHLLPLLEDVDAIGDVGSWPALVAVDVRSGEIGASVRPDGVSELEARAGVAAARHVLAAWQRDVPPAWASRLEAIVVRSDGPGGWTAAFRRGGPPSLHVDVDELGRVTSPQVVVHEFAHLVGNLDGDPTAEPPATASEEPCFPACHESLETQFTLRFWPDVGLRALPHPHEAGAGDAALARLKETPGAFLDSSAAASPTEDFAVTLASAILAGLNPAEFVPPPVDDTVTLRQKLAWMVDQPRLAEVIETTIAHRADVGPLPGPDGLVPPA